MKLLNWKIITIIGCVSLLSLAGCVNADPNKPSGTEDKKEAESNTDSDSGDAELEAALAAVEDYNPEDYVELTDYKGLEVNVYVSDDDVDSAIMTLLSQNTTVEQIKEGTVKEGDTVNIKFVGKMNGVEFDGGTADSYDLEIGSHSFIDGFEDGLIGMSVGDTKTLNLKFPDPYQTNPDYSGKPVDFDVTINYINGKTIVPEYNDEFVKTYTNGEYTSAEEYKKVIKEQLIEDKRTSGQEAAFNTVLSTTKVNDAPEFLVNIMKLRLDASYRQMAASNGFSDFNEFLSSKWEITEEQYNEELVNKANIYVQQKLVTEAIAKKENIEVTDEEYKESLDQYMKNLNLSTEEEFNDYIVKNFRSEPKSIIRDALITEKVMQFVKDNTVEIDTPPTPAPSESADSDTDDGTSDDALKGGKATVDDKSSESDNEEVTADKDQPDKGD